MPIAYQTVGDIDKLLTKDGHLCTTCCAAECITRRWAWQLLQAQGYWNIQQTLPLDNHGNNGFWRVLRLANNQILNSGSVNADGWMIGLPIQFHNNTDSPSYYEIGFSCDGIEWEYWEYPPAPGESWLDVFVKANGPYFWNVRLENPSLLDEGGWEYYDDWRLLVKKSSGGSWHELDWGWIDLNGKIATLEELYTCSWTDTTDWILRLHHRA